MVTNLDKARHRIGFVGLGNLGAPMAHMIAHEGWRLSVFARKQAQLDIFAGTGAEPVSSPERLGERSDLVCVMVGHDRDVFDAVVESGMLGRMRAGSIISIHSTVHPDTCRRIAELAAVRGVAVTDAPVAGGSTIQTLVLSLGLRLNAPPTAAPGRAAAPGKLAVMAGADPEVFDSCRPVFETFGDPVRHMGAVGAGQMTKLVNNLLVYATNGVAAHAFEVAKGLGLDLDSLLDIVTRGSAQSLVASLFGPHFRMGIHPEAQNLMRKDIELGVELMEKHALAAPTLVEAARHTLDRAALRY